MSAGFEGQCLKVAYREAILADLQRIVDLHVSNFKYVYRGILSDEYLDKQCLQVNNLIAISWRSHLRFLIISSKRPEIGQRN